MCVRCNLGKSVSNICKSLCCVHTLVGSTDFTGRTATWQAWVKSESEVTQSCPTLWDPMDCSTPGSSLHGILQARVLEWVAISFSRGSSRPRDRTWVSLIPGRRFNLWATREAHILSYLLSKRMGCLSGCLVSSASIQKLFCGIFSVFKRSFDEFVQEKVVSPSYSFIILGPPLHWLEFNCPTSL